MRQPSRLDDEAALCAHDLRGALAVVTGYVELLQRPDLSETDRARALTGIDGAVGRAGALLDRLLGLPGQGTATGTVELAALAERAAQDAHAASGRSVVVHAQDAPAVRGDAVAFARVLQNLLENATRYAPTGPIEVTVSRVQDRAVLEVADRGPGIPEGQLAHVLQPRARLARDEETPGSGLGLTVVRVVAETSGGSFQLRRREGGGLVARVELPI